MISMAVIHFKQKWHFFSISFSLCVHAHTKTCMCVYVYMCAYNMQISVDWCLFTIGHKSIFFYFSFFLLTIALSVNVSFYVAVVWGEGSLGSSLPFSTHDPPALAPCELLFQVHAIMPGLWVSLLVPAWGQTVTMLICQFAWVTSMETFTDINNAVINSLHMDLSSVIRPSA